MYVCCKLRGFGVHHSLPRVGVRTYGALHQAATAMAQAQHLSQQVRRQLFMTASQGALHPMVKPTLWHSSLPRCLCTFHGLGALNLKMHATSACAYPHAEEGLSDMNVSRQPAACNCCRRLGCRLHVLRAHEMPETAKRNNTPVAAPRCRAPLVCPEWVCPRAALPCHLPLVSPLGALQT